jgi:hypothetical protein
MDGGAALGGAAFGIEGGAALGIDGGTAFGTDGGAGAFGGGGGGDKTSSGDDLRTAIWLREARRSASFIVPRDLLHCTQAYSLEPHKFF